MAIAQFPTQTLLKPWGEIMAELSDALKANDLIDVRAIAPGPTEPSDPHQPEKVNRP